MRPGFGGKRRSRLWDVVAVHYSARGFCLWSYEEEVGRTERSFFLSRAAEMRLSRGERFSCEVVSSRKGKPVLTGQMRGTRRC